MKNTTHRSFSLLLALLWSVFCLVKTINSHRPRLKTSPAATNSASYTAAKGKLNELNKRFRNHTTKLFEKHGMTNVGYWTPLDNPDESSATCFRTPIGPHGGCLGWLHGRHHLAAGLERKRGGRRYHFENRKHFPENHRFLSQ
ncbi:MAG: NIPSNAP family protein [Saprospiraceae bacterium]|nr:NIPSNAP family protein [Saprospiraceae bacterium]